jgi:DNA primase
VVGRKERRNIMIDIETLKNSTDLIDLIGRDVSLRRKGANEYSGPCPFCGGRDRFNVQRTRWLCRNCTEGKWKDAIEYIQRREKCDFRTACKYLGAPDDLPSRPHPVPRAIESTNPSAEWQLKAQKLVKEATDILWLEQGAKIRAWLNGRGLNDDTLRRWQIGFVPGGAHEWTNIAGLKVPCGITIPCEIENAIWYVKVRRLEGQPKYQAVSGGRAALFGAQSLRDREKVILTEGEFDAMLLHQESGDMVGVATMASASSRPSETMLHYLASAHEWLIAYDYDEAGMRGAEWWMDNSDRARPAYVPKIRAQDKDITDYWEAGGDLRGWVAFLTA